MKPRVVVYTAAVGDRDPLREPVVRADGVEYVCFTDNTGQDGRGWTLRQIDWIGDDPVRTARHVKLRPHHYFENADFSLWVDANILPACDPIQLIERFLGDGDLAVHSHPHRDCLFDEIACCITLYKDLLPTLRAQAEHYRRLEHPRHTGLYESGVVLRRHCDSVLRFNELWWAEVEAWSNRDQVCLPFVLRNAPVTLKLFPFELRSNDYFRYLHHEVKPHPKYRRYLAIRRALGRIKRSLCGGAEQQ